jgi:hypothetical protein
MAAGHRNCHGGRIRRGVRGGDFTAAQSGGRAIAVLEAMSAQVFLATLVARLVTAYRGPARPASAT